MDLLVYDDEDRRFVPWMVSVAAVVLVGLLAAGIAYLFARQTHADAIGGVSAPAPATASATGPSAVASPPAPASPAPACLEALEQADTALKRSTRIEEALAEHTRLMDEVLAERLTPEQAMDHALPVLIDAATDRERFAEELVAYQRFRKDCTA